MGKLIKSGNVGSSSTKWSGVYIELTNTIKHMSAYEWRDAHNPVLTRLQYLIINVYNSVNKGLM